jgi:hypothetical protein
MIQVFKPKAKYHTLASRVIKSVVGSTAIALTLCSTITILILRHSYTNLAYREIALRTERSSGFINPTLLSTVLRRNPRTIGDDASYNTLAEQLGQTVEAIPESSADLIVIGNAAYSEPGNADGSKYDCAYIMSVSELGLLRSDRPFNHPIDCPSQAVASLGVPQIAMITTQSRLWLPDKVTVYRPIKNGINTVGVLAINFNIARVTDFQIKTFTLIFAVQVFAIAVIIVTIEKLIAASMKRLTVIVGACQDLAVGNYEIVSGVPNEMIDLDELDVLAIELKSAADKLAQDR